MSDQKRWQEAGEQPLPTCEKNIHFVVLHGHVAESLGFNPGEIVPNTHRKILRVDCHGFDVAVYSPKYSRSFPLDGTEYVPYTSQYDAAKSLFQVILNSINL